MEKEEDYKEKYEFKIKPCNFKLEIKEIKPLYVYCHRPLVLDLKIRDSYNIESYVSIKSRPVNGELYKFSPSTFIYRANRNFCGMDLFQLVIKNECGDSHVESVLICVKS